MGIQIRQFEMLETLDIRLFLMLENRHLDILKCEKSKTFCNDRKVRH